MKGLAAVLLALVSASTFAQSETPRPIRLTIRHADPWAVKAMLEGRQILSPELSTVLALSGGAPPAMAQATAPLVMNGRFMVNPTDNTLWFFPDRVAR